VQDAVGLAVAEIPGRGDREQRAVADRSGRRGMPLVASCSVCLEELLPAYSLSRPTARPTFDQLLAPIRVVVIVDPSANSPRAVA